jgi:hypothetical protein
MDDSIGELAVQAGPARQQGLRNGPLWKLPTRIYAGCWVNQFFRVEAPQGKGQAGWRPRGRSHRTEEAERTLHEPHQFQQISTNLTVWGTRGSTFLGIAYLKSESKVATLQ